MSICARRPGNRSVSSGNARVRSAFDTLFLGPVYASFFYREARQAATHGVLRMAFEVQLENSKQTKRMPRQTFYSKPSLLWPSSLGCVIHCIRCMNCIEHVWMLMHRRVSSPGEVLLFLKECMWAYLVGNGRSLGLSQRKSSGLMLEFFHHNLFCSFRIYYSKIHWRSSYSPPD